MTTYLGSGDASKHRQDYRPDWLDNLADVDLCGLAFDGGDGGIDSHVVVDAEQLAAVAAE